MRLKGIYDMSETPLSKKYCCDYFQIIQENEKTYSVLLVVKDERGYKVKKNNPNKRMNKSNVDAYFRLGQIKEI